DKVRSVVTLGSPFANDVRATNATRLYEALSGETVEQHSELQQAIAGDLPVPTTSIYSKSDGIVNWRTCVLRPSDTAENIEVRLASHVGLGVNPAALWAVADRLAQGEGHFMQFDRSVPFAIAYAPAEHAQSAWTSRRSSRRGWKRRRSTSIIPPGSRTISSTSTAISSAPACRRRAIAPRWSASSAGCMRSFSTAPGRCGSSMSSKA